MRLAIGYRVRVLTREDAERIARWRYPVPYDFYDSAPANASPETLAATATYYLRPEHGYCAVDDETGNFLGFGCWGEEAQVTGYDYTQVDALEIGFGMRPDRVGSGRGQRFLAAILKHAIKTYRPTILRATIAAFNERSAHTFLHAGFVRIDSFRSQTLHPVDFCVYTRNV